MDAVFVDMQGPCLNTIPNSVDILMFSKLMGMFIYTFSVFTWFGHLRLRDSKTEWVLYG